MSHAFEPTAAEIGLDPMALARAAYERRKLMFAPIPKPKPKPQPVAVVEVKPPEPQPKPVIVDANVWALIEEQRREAVEEYKRKLEEEAAEKAKEIVPLKLQEIMAFVSKEYGVSITDIKSNRRIASIVLPRQVFMYYCKTYTLRSFPYIATHCGGRDHTTAMYGVRKIQQLIEAGKFIPASENYIRSTLGLPVVGQSQFESSRVHTTGAGE